MQESRTACYRQIVIDEHTGTTTVKPVLSDHSKIGKMKVLKTGGSLLQVESIADIGLENLFR